MVDKLHRYIWPFCKTLAFLLQKKIMGSNDRFVIHNKKARTKQAKFRKF